MKISLLAISWLLGTATATLLLDGKPANVTIDHAIRKYLGVKGDQKQGDTIKSLEQDFERYKNILKNADAVDWNEAHKLIERMRLLIYRPKLKLEGKDAPIAVDEKLEEWTKLRNNPKLKQLKLYGDLLKAEQGLGAYSEELSKVKKWNKDKARDLRKDIWEKAYQGQFTLDLMPASYAVDRALKNYKYAGDSAKEKSLHATRLRRYIKVLGTTQGDYAKEAKKLIEDIQDVLGAGARIEVIPAEEQFASDDEILRSEKAYLEAYEAAKVRHSSERILPAGRQVRVSTPPGSRAKNFYWYIIPHNLNEMERERLVNMIEAYLSLSARDKDPTRKTVEYRNALRQLQSALQMGPILEDPVLHYAKTSNMAHPEKYARRVKEEQAQWALGQFSAHPRTYRKAWIGHHMKVPNGVFPPTQYTLKDLIWTYADIYAIEGPELLKEHAFLQNKELASDKEKMKAAILGQVDEFLGAALGQKRKELWRPAGSIFHFVSSWVGWYEPPDVASMERRTRLRWIAVLQAVIRKERVRMEAKYPTNEPLLQTFYDLLRLFLKDSPHIDDPLITFATGKNEILGPYLDEIRQIQYDAVFKPEEIKYAYTRLSEIFAVNEIPIPDFLFPPMEPYTFRDLIQRTKNSDEVLNDFLKLVEEPPQHILETPYDSADRFIRRLFLKARGPWQIPKTEPHFIAASATDEESVGTYWFDAAPELENFDPELTRVMFEAAYIDRMLKIRKSSVKNPIDLAKVEAWKQLTGQLEARTETSIGNFDAAIAANIVENDHDPRAEILEQIPFRLAIQPHRNIIEGIIEPPNLKNEIYIVDPAFPPEGSWFFNVKAYVNQAFTEQHRRVPEVLMPSLLQLVIQSDRLELMKDFEKTGEESKLLLEAAGDGSGESGNWSDDERGELEYDDLGVSPDSPSKEENTPQRRYARFLAERLKERKEAEANKP